MEYATKSSFSREFFVGIIVFMRNIFADIFFRWLPFAVVVTVLCVFAYAAVQQDMRQSANDPQIQIAQDMRGLGPLGQGGVDPQDFVSNATPTEITYLAPFFMIFDEQGNVLASSGYLRGQIPKLPTGVFEAVRRYGERRFTWVPEPAIRNAVVMIHFTGDRSGFFLAGRSLREVENRESQLALMAGAAWIGGLVGTFLAVCFGAFFSRKNIPR